MAPIDADINKLIDEPATDPDFPHAPQGWTRAGAERIGREEGLDLGTTHWEAVRALQKYYAHHDDDSVINMRELHDALDEHFHAQGGLKYLYTVFPAGPIAQICRLAGLKPPFIATDPGFGTVA